VTSLPEPDGDGYVTIVNAASAQQHLISAFDIGSAGTPPPGFHLSSGVYELRVENFYAYPYVQRSGEPGYSQLAAWNGSGWVRLASLVFDGDPLDLDGPFNGTVTLRVAPVTFDTTPPVVECPSAAPTFLLNDPRAEITVGVTDDDSGVASSQLAVPVGASALGDQWVSVVARDRIGNEALAFCPYRVGVDIKIVSPKPGAVEEIAGGTIVAIQWQARDFHGRPVFDVGHFVSISASPLACRGDNPRARPRMTAGPFVGPRGLWRHRLRTPTEKGCYTIRVVSIGDVATTVFRVN
jgi:hypothetical protein